MNVVISDDLVAIVYESANNLKQSNHFYAIVEVYFHLETSIILLMQKFDPIVDQFSFGHPPLFLIIFWIRRDSIIG